MKKYNFFLLLSFGLFLACNGSNTKSDSDSKFSAEELKEQQDLWDELMVVHDEVMPKISNIHKLGRQLKNYSETAEDIPNEVKEQVAATISLLDEADESMFSWMSNLRQLKPLQDTEKHEDIVIYLRAEQDRMDKVKKNMLMSMEKGSMLVQELGITNQK